jgi:hypothetical protein
MVQNWKSWKKNFIYDVELEMTLLTPMRNLGLQ